MKEWEKYEEQIFEKLRADFPDGEILKNQKIKGIFSKRSRQIDILIKGNLIGKEIIGVIDCKKFSKKINVKTVESFIGFLEDVGANLGIMITNKGYSKSAENRVRNYTRDIRLDIVAFEDFESYRFCWDECDICRVDGFAKGEIIWMEPLGLVNNGKVTLIQNGECSYCGERYVKCQGCGQIIHIEEYSDGQECYCGNIFHSRYEYIGEGLTEQIIYVNNNDDGEIEEFNDPNQTKLFE